METALPSAKISPQVSRENARVSSILMKISIAIWLTMGWWNIAAKSWEVIHPQKNCQTIRQLPTVPINPNSSLSDRMQSAREYVHKYPPSSQHTHYYPIVIESPNWEVQKLLTATRTRKTIKWEKNETIELWPGKFPEIDWCFRIDIKTNGLNSHLIVTDTVWQLWKVLAWNGHSKYSTGELWRWAYTPNSHLRHDKSIIEEGRVRIKDTIRAAKEEIEKGQILSLWYSGKLLSEVINEEFIRLLFMIEKKDPTQYIWDPMNWPKIFEEQMSPIEWRVWSNRDLAYYWQVSEARACGIAQITPNSYKMILKKYPWLGLHTDFEVACRDHIQSIKIMYAHIDIELEIYRQKASIRESLERDGKDLFEIYLAIGYNSNAKKFANNKASSLEENPKMSAVERMRKLLPKLPRQNIIPDKPEKGKRESETLRYILKTIYFLKHQWRNDTWINDLLQYVIEEIQRQIQEEAISLEWFRESKKIKNIPIPSSKRLSKVIFKKRK